MKLLIAILAVAALPFACHFSWLGLKFTGVVRTDGLAPVKLPPGRMVGYGPGLAVISASGGNIYKLRPETLEQIKAEELDYFTQITANKTGDYHLSGGWVRCEAYDRSLWTKNGHCGITPFLSSPGYGSSEALWKAMETSPYYVGLGHGAQYRIIVSPKAEQMFIGWFD